MPIANTCSIGYPHDSRADNAAYRHDRRVDNAAYRHDRRADSLSRQHHAILIDWLILFYFSVILAISGPEADCRYLPKFYGGPHDTPLDNPYCSYSNFLHCYCCCFIGSRRRLICAPGKTLKRWIFLIKLICTNKITILVKYKTFL